MPDIKIHPSWKEALAPQFEQEYWQKLSTHVRTEYTTKIVYPHAKHVFRAFDLCPFDSVKVVIIGQDPYHGAGQAHGLSFSVRDGISLPPSLRNIYQEIKNDLGITPLPSGDLSRWAEQGVLMLNSVLTVLANKPASHAGVGWETFTDGVIHTLNEHKKHVVYLLWGKYAQTKGMAINKEENLVLMSGHPSPYSASLFFNKHHFSQANGYLMQHNIKPIDWR